MECTSLIGFEEFVGGFVEHVVSVASFILLLSSCFVVGEIGGDDIGLLLL